MVRSWFVVALIAASAWLAIAESAAARNLRRQEGEDGAASPSDLRPMRPMPMPTQLQKQVQSPYQAPYQSPYQAPYQAPIQKGGCAPCVKVIPHGRSRCCDVYQTVLYHCDPCTGCTTAIPLCLPVCCDGEPRVVERVGALGRSVVVYRWCCGTVAKVITDRCGDIVVHLVLR